MPQASVGNVENIQETLHALGLARESIESETEQMQRMVALKTEEVQEENAHSARLLEDAIELESRAQSAMADAEDLLERAEQHLSRAHASLSRCESQDDDEDGNSHCCHHEECAVEEAESEVESATSRLIECRSNLERAMESRFRMERRLETAKHAERRVLDLQERVAVHGGDIRTQSRLLGESGQSRLREAQVALDTYLGTSQATAAVAKYLNWSPTQGTLVTPQMIADRLNFSTQQCSTLIQYWADREPRFRSKLAGYRERLDQSQGASERLAVQLKIRQNLAGEVAERLVVQALAPLGDYSKTQTRRVLDDGRATIVDFNLENLRVPVVLGKGQRMGAAVGESIAVEVKCGQPSYLLGQRDHMTFQAKGHRDATASITICSRDIKDLPAEEEETLRRDLREAGSAMTGMLPRKAEIDRACWDAVNSIQANGDWR